MFNEYKQLHNLDLFSRCNNHGTKGKYIDYSEMLILLKKSGAIKSKEGSAQMVAANAHTSREKKRRTRSAICIIL